MCQGAFYLKLQRPTGRGGALMSFISSLFLAFLKPFDRTSRRLRPGFTLVEMAIVVVVIGILIGAAYMRGRDVQQRALMALMKNDLSNFALAEEIASQKDVGYLDVATATSQGFRFSSGVSPVTSTVTLASWFLKLKARGTLNTCEAGASSADRSSILILCRDSEGRVIDGGSSADAPRVSFQVTPATVQPGEAVMVDASASTGVAPVAIRIDFGDGASGIGPTATHVYGQSGTYTVQVTATDGQGRQASGVHVVLVDQPGLTASFGARPNPVVAGVPVTFASSSRADGV